MLIEKRLQSLSEKFGAYRKTSYYEEVRFNCPFCEEVKSPDTKYHLYINLERLVGFCFRCNKILSPNYLKKLVNEDRDYYIPLDFGKKTNNKLSEIYEYESISNPRSWYWLISKYGHIYKHSDLERFCNYFGIVYVSSKDLIMIPIFWFGDLVGFQFRRLSNEEPKYLTFGYLDRSVNDILFNFDKCMNEREVFICEGVFDGLPFFLNNKSFIAMFGKNVSKNKLKLLSNLQAEVIHIVLDGDAYKEAQELARKLNSIFQFSKKILVWKLPEDKDPASLGLSVFSEEVVSREEILF